MFKKLLSTLFLCILFVFHSSMSFAMTVVNEDVTNQIADTQADILTVGGALIGLAVIALAIRWVKATFF